MSLIDKIPAFISTQNAEVNSSNTIKYGGILAILYTILFRYLYNQSWSFPCTGWKYSYEKHKFISTDIYNLELALTLIAFLLFSLTIFAYRNLLLNRFKSLKAEVGGEYLLAFIPFFNLLYLVHLMNLKENEYISFVEYVKKQSKTREHLMLLLISIVFLGSIFYTIVVVMFSFKQPTLMDVLEILIPVGLFNFYFVLNIFLVKNLKYYIVVFIGIHLIYYFVKYNSPDFDFGIVDIIYLGKLTLFACAIGFLFHSYFHYRLEEEIAPETREDYLEMFEV